MPVASAMGPILLLGKTGQVGWELRRTLAPVAPVMALGRQDIDLGQPDQIRGTIREIDPSLIINAAAYTAVDRAEEERDLAWAVNAVAPGILAEEAKRLKIPLVHYSTDYVFGGRLEGASGTGDRQPYRESDAPCPLNEYGRSKLAGDRAIQSVDPPHLIFRTSWVYSMRGRNFLLAIRKQAREKSELTVVSDQIGSPTWARLIAEATAQILSQTSAGDLGQHIKDRSGLYHMSAAGRTSWHGFAEAILERARLREAETIKAETVEEISTEQLNLRAERPQFSALDCSNLRETFGVVLPDWSLQLDLCLDV